MKGFVDSRGMGVATGLHRGLVILAIIGVSFVSMKASAFDLDDGFDSASVRASRGGGPARLYLGGRDEGNLEVQDSLPTPVRSISAVGGVPQPIAPEESESSASGETSSND